LPLDFLLVIQHPAPVCFTSQAGGKKKFWCFQQSRRRFRSCLFGETLGYATRVCLVETLYYITN